MRVAVVGAGVSGITAAKCLLDEGIEPVVYEQAATLGGVWRYDEALLDGGGPAYRGLRTNTTKQTTAYSDLPFPAHLPANPPRAEVLRYLDEYADRFLVRERVRFRTAVVRIAPVSDGHWAVETRSEDGAQVESFDAVMVGSGVFRDPVIPAVTGLERFAGTVMHSRAYTVPDPFAGQTVLVVGGGSSATDVAIEASGVARQVLMSVRGTIGGATSQAPATSKVRVWLDRLAPPLLRVRLRRRAQLLARRIIPTRKVQPDAPFVLGTPPYTPGEKLRGVLASLRIWSERRRS